MAFDAIVSGIFFKFIFQFFLSLHSFLLSPPLCLYLPTSILQLVYDSFFLLGILSPATNRFSLGGKMATGIAKPNSLKVMVPKEKILPCWFHQEIPQEVYSWTALSDQTQQVLRD